MIGKRMDLCAVKSHDIIQGRLGTWVGSDICETISENKENSNPS